MRILFVDDDVHLLRGLRRMLFRQAREWQMEFEETGADAVTRLTSQHFDLLITDMRMPGMDGMEVLRQAQLLVPGVFRGVLSGQVDRDAVLLAMPLAHHFLRKPCAPERIQSIVTRVRRLHRMLPDPALRAAVGSIVRLPARTSIRRRLEQELARDEPALDRIAALVGQDIALSAKVLHVADTPFFSPPPRFLDVAEAVGFLGTSAVRLLLCQEDLFSEGDEDELEKLLRHSRLVARLLERLLPSQPLAFTTGLLHDIGRLSDAPAPQKAPLPARRSLAPGVSHEVLGAYLLGLWGAPITMVEAVAGHRDPTALQARTLSLGTGLALANRLAEEVAGGDPVGGDLNLPVDLESLRSDARGLAGP
jgi:HD-like signal output (HDOD) protein/CheY-like chemotaxis protein